MALYVTDTHPLLWYGSGRRTLLSETALRIFNGALRGRVLVYIPAVAIWEISVLLKRGRIALSQPVDR
jgi:PIN domain nuclease of toxin-antitoxin system